MPTELRMNPPLHEETSFDSEDGDASGTRNRDVQFYLPTSRRASEENGSRPRAFAINQDSSQCQLLSFHTFALSSQSGSATTVVLPSTEHTGCRILTMCRDDAMRCIYFDVRKVADGDSACLLAAPRNEPISSFPLEKPWKVAALASFFPGKEEENAILILALLVYHPDSNTSEPESEKTKSSASKNILIIAWINAEDTTLEQPKLAHIPLSFLPHGCNQLIWWESPLNKELILILPSQHGPVFATKVNRYDTCDLVLENFEDCVPDFTFFNSKTVTNAVDCIDAECNGDRLVATSSSARSVIGAYLWKSEEKEWINLWNIQHDSFTTKLKFFRANPQSTIVHLLVVGLLELAVVYIDIYNNRDQAKSVTLPGSNQHDVVTSCCIADIDLDGVPEILLGTYGRVVLFYKCLETEAVLLRTLEIAFPVLDLHVADMTKDGNQELTVLTQKGLQVFSLM